MLINFLRQRLPASWLRLYHWWLAVSGHWWYGHPARELIVIGVTGTSGKSTTIFLLTHILQQAGFKVGVISTIEIRVGAETKLNNKKMTQLGRWQTPYWLRQMVTAGCTVALVETTSQGIEQFRHYGLEYDVAVLTNLYPEHLRAHGGFVNYKNAKRKLFTYTAGLLQKSRWSIPKTFIVNGLVKEAAEFLAPPAARKWTVLAALPAGERAWLPSAVTTSALAVSFVLEATEFWIPLGGEHIITDAVLAVATAAAIGVPVETSAAALRTVPAVPGRIEFISLPNGSRAIVDFAFEPIAMEKLYAVVAQLPHQKVIHVLGGTGGGRDTERRAILGQIAGEKADLVVVTNEDPYDDDPQEIMQQVAAGAKASGKIEQKDLYLVEDRRQAIVFALRHAGSEDVVLITGKGSEQAIVGKNRTLMPWDDRQVVREEAAKLSDHEH